MIELLKAADEEAGCADFFVFVLRDVLPVYLRRFSCFDTIYPPFFFIRRNSTR